MGEACVQVEVGGEAITLMPERAAWWGAARTLLVADLHLGKSEAMRVAGMPVPDVDLDEQFERLERAVERCGGAGDGVRRVVVVGDLIHARAGLTERIGASVGERFARLRGMGIQTVLVEGNHDRRVGMARGVWSGWGVEVVGELDEGGLRFVHEPREEPGRAVVCGHLHPALTVGGGCGAAKAPAFVVSRWGLVLPAFSRFTAGGRIARERGQRWFPIADGRVMEFGARTSGAVW